MSCIHITACQLASSPSAFPAQPSQLSKASICPSIYLGTKLPKVCFELTYATSRYQRAQVVSLFGGKGKSDNGNEGSPWKALENAVGNLRKNKSVEDVLKQQIEKQEYYDDEGPGGKPPGGGSGGGDGFGEAEDEGMWEEHIQVFLATFGLVFVYIYIIRPQDVTALAKDLVRFLFTRKLSVRLKRLGNLWNQFLERMKKKEEFVDPYWLEKSIVNSTTWYDSPAKYRYIKARKARPLDDDDNYNNAKYRSIKARKSRPRDDYDYDNDNYNDNGNDNDNDNYNDDYE